MTSRTTLLLVCKYTHQAPLYVLSKPKTKTKTTFSNVTMKPRIQKINNMTSLSHCISHQNCTGTPHGMFLCQGRVSRQPLPTSVAFLVLRLLKPAIELQLLRKLATALSRKTHPSAGLQPLRSWNRRAN